MSEERADPQGLAPLALAGERALELPSGRRLEVRLEPSGAETLVVRSTAGECVLRVRLTDEGPVFSFSAASLELESAGRMALRAESLEVEARSLRLDVAGSLVEHVGGDAVRRAEGTSTLAARDVLVAAEPGGVEIRANDDVDLVGERVRLNSEDPPMPLTWEEHRRRHGEPAAAVHEPPLSSACGLPEASEHGRLEGKR